MVKGSKTSIPSVIEGHVKVVKYEGTDTCPRCRSFIRTTSVSCPIFEQGRLSGGLTWFFYTHPVVVVDLVPPTTNSVHTVMQSFQSYEYRKLGRLGAGPLRTILILTSVHVTNEYYKIP